MSEWQINDIARFHTVEHLLQKKKKKMAKSKPILFQKLHMDSYQDQQD